MPVNRPYFRYWVLAFLFAITVAYEVPYLRDILRDETRKVPFFTMETATDRVDTVTKEAAQAGIHKGDEVLSIAGRPYNGLGDWAQPLVATPIGGGIDIVLRSPDPSSPGERTVVLPVGAAATDLWRLAGALTLYFLLPAICLLLGFWVAFQRPRDPMAWLLLALMLTFPHIFESYKAEAWPPGWREAAMFYHALLGSLLPLVMFLFGRFFPEPFATGTRWDKAWKVQQWVLAVPFTIFAMVGAIESVIDLSSYRSEAVLERATHPFDRLMQVVVYLLIGSFFAAMGFKYGVSRSTDTRRRLRILCWGAAVAWTPGLLVTSYPRLLGKPMANVFPQWLILAASVPLVLFPLTLAYVIVVQKAMDVSVALRQGLQYALARGTVRVVRGGLTIGLIWASVSLLQRSKSGSLRFYFIIAAAIVVGLGLRNFGDWLRTFTDRRFFRDAARAEQILATLSDEVRSIVETRPLLERVASKIGEALFVPRVAVLLENGGAYRPAYALGYPSTPAVEFPETAETVHRLRREPEPERVYFDDEESWVNSAALTDEERSKLEALAPELLVPLSVKEKLLGIISLGEKKSEEPYSGSEIRLLKSVAAQTGLALANAELTTTIAEEVARREKLNREVEIAREVQERLFPQNLPPIAGLDYFGRCRTALGVGGDYYDFLALPDGKLGVALGDVSGKGIAAALMMASLEASIRAEAIRAGNDLAGMIGRVNRLIYDASAEDRYATLFYGQYDPALRRLSYVNAGHCAPILFRFAKSLDGGPVAPRQGAIKVDRLDQAGGPVVGLMPDCPYEQADVCMSPGDVLIVYTDGISEAMNQALEEWGEQRLIAAVSSADGQPAEQIIARILKAADAFAAGASQHDDMTLVVLCARPD